MSITACVEKLPLPTVALGKVCTDVVLPRRTGYKPLRDAVQRIMLGLARPDRYSAACWPSRAQCLLDPAPSAR
jgi:hypothetical protein